MLKRQLFFFLFLVCKVALSQIVFEPGYYVDNQDNRIQGLIKNVDWKNNPDKFTFKSQEGSVPIEITITAAKEFGILKEPSIKYKRFSVDIDRSSDVTSSLSTKRSPEFQREDLFLKVLIEGTATLFFYEDANLRRFFYSLNNSNAKQLVYKKYLNLQGYRSENDLYKQQLLKDLSLVSAESNRIDVIRYKKKDLVNYFIEFNQSNNYPFKDYDLKDRNKKIQLNLSFRLGVTSQSFVLDAPNSFSRETDFGNQISPRFGLELENILPFNKNKWSIFLGINYKQYQAQTDAEQEGISRMAETEFELLEIPVGLRHYFFLSDNSKLFLNASYNIVFIPESVVDGGFGSNVTVGKTTGLAFGLGFEWKNNIGTEFRYNSYQDILTFTQRTSSFNGLSLLFYYKI